MGKYPIKESLAFITVGSTVGVGIVYNGKIAHGLASTEGGHIMYYLKNIELRDHLCKAKPLEVFALIIKIDYA